MSQLRKHIKFTWRHILRTWRHKARLDYLGRNVWIDKNVEFLRFPGNISVKDEVVIKEGVRICSCNKKAKVNIGARSTIGYHTFLFASIRITVGEDCLIAPFVYIVDSDHSIRKDAKINLQPNNTAPILIGNDVWISSNVTILKGVSIANGAVIAANSLVNKDIGPYEIWGGSPAKKIGDRK